MTISTWLNSRRALALVVLSFAVACTKDMTGVRPIDAKAVDVAFCDTPTWVAFQDGDGAWTRATPPTIAGAVSTYHHTFTTDRGGIAIARDFGGDLTALLIFYGTPDELPTMSATAPAACGATSFKTLRGKVAGIDTNEIARLTSGRGTEGAFVSIGTGPDFTIRGLSSGPHDILATRTRIVDGTVTLNGIILRRTPDLPNQTSLDPIDFKSTEAFFPASHSLTLTGPAATGASGFVGLRTVHGIDDQLAAVTTTGSGTALQYAAIPDEHLDAGDLQSITMNAAPVGATVRSASVYFRSARDQTLRFGVLPHAPALTVAATSPALRTSAEFSVDHDYDRLTSISYQQGQTTFVTVSMTAAYAASHTNTYDLLIPALNDVDGFDSHWALKPGAPLLWTATRVGGSLNVGLNAIPVDGSTRRSATQGGNFNP